MVEGCRKAMEDTSATRNADALADGGKLAMKTRSLLVTSTLALATAACGNTSAYDRDDALAASEALEAVPNAPAPREILDVSKGACPVTHPLAGATCRSRRVRTTSAARCESSMTARSRSPISHTTAAAERSSCTARSAARIQTAPRSRAISCDRRRRTPVRSSSCACLRRSGSVISMGLSVWCSDVNVSFGDVEFR
jgi:hypothetical protein